MFSSEQWSDWTSGKGCQNKIITQDTGFLPPPPLPNEDAYQAQGKEAVFDHCLFVPNMELSVNVVTCIVLACFPFHVTQLLSITECLYP